MVHSPVHQKMVRWHYSGAPPRFLYGPPPHCNSWSSFLTKHDFFRITFKSLFSYADIRRKQLYQFLFNLSSFIHFNDLIIVISITTIIEVNRFFFLFYPFEKMCCKNHQRLCFFFLLIFTLSTLINYNCVLCGKWYIILFSPSHGLFLI